MSDSMTLEEERKKQALNTNAPTTSVIAPFIQAMTQGNPGAAVEADEAAKKADRSVTNDFVKSIQTTASQIDAAFRAGQSSVSPNPTSANINTGASLLGRSASEILSIKADADARIASKDALAEAQQTEAMRRRIISAGINPDGKALDDTLSAIGSSLTSATGKIKEVAEMRKQGFFDNPAAYLYNNIINIPMTAMSAARDVAGAKILQGGLAATADALKQSSVIDAAYFSSKDTERAQLVATSTLAAGKAAAMQPLTTAFQQSMGALNLKVSEGQLGVAQGHLALAQTASARAGELHPLQVEAARIRNRMDELKIAEYPQEQKARQLQIEKLQLDIANAPTAKAKAESEAELARLQVARAKEDLELAPGRKTLQDMQIGYYAEVKEGQIITNKTNQLVLNETLEKLRKTNEGRQIQLDTINAGLKALGLKGELTSVEGMDEKRAKALFSIGMDFVQKGSIGIDGDPAATYQRLHEAGIGFGENTPAGWQVSKKAVDDVMNQVNAELDKIKPGEAKLTGPARQTAFQNGVRQNFINQQTTGKGWAPENGIFSIPSADVLTKNEALANNPLIKDIAPLAVDASGNSRATPVDGTLLMNTAAAAVAKGKLSESDAVKALAEVAKTIQQSANITFGYAASGIPVVANQFNTMFTKPGNAWGNNSDRVNLLDRADTLLKLRRQMAAQQTIDTVRNSAGGFLGLPSATGNQDRTKLEQVLRSRVENEPPTEFGPNKPTDFQLRKAARNARGE